MAGVTALADSVDGVLVELVVEALGNGSKAICITNTGPLQEPLPPPPPPPLLGVWVELCSVTSLTPSIRRSRSIVSATTAWLVAQPLSVKVGTLPGGVAEVTLEPVAPAAPVELALEVEPALEVELAPVAALLAAAETLAVGLGEDPPVLDPIVPVSEVSATSLGAARGRVRGRHGPSQSASRRVGQQPAPAVRAVP